MDDDMTDNKKDFTPVALKSTKPFKVNPFLNFLKKLDALIWYKKKTWQEKAASIFATAILLILINPMIFELFINNIIVNIFVFIGMVFLNIISARWALNAKWRANSPDIRKTPSFFDNTSYCGLSGNKYHTRR